MNIILTGQRQVGKSTVLASVLKQLRRPVSGFRTYYDRNSRTDRSLYLESWDGSQCRAAVSWSTFGAEVHTDVFNTLGTELVSQRGSLLVMDELGKFEVNAELFHTAVEAAFDSASDVLAVIRFDAEGWIQELKSRPDVTLYTVTLENREQIPTAVLQQLLH